MELSVDIQYATEDEDDLPSEHDLRSWACAALASRRGSAQLTIRITGREESRRLNETYRRKAGPTNVLSFSFEEPELLQPPLLGDVVICAPIVAAEAREQGKAPRAHWAHMVVHGVLHLLGYDHENEDDARRMEAEERKVLAGLGYGDPYDEEDNAGNDDRLYRKA